MDAFKYPKLTDKQRKLVDSLDEPDENNTRRSKGDTPKDDPEGAGRKGGKRRQRRLREETQLGPDVLIDALNIVVRGRSTHEAPTMGREVLELLIGVPTLFPMTSQADVEEEAIVWLPLLHAVETIQGAVDFMVLDKNPKSEGAARYIDGLTESMTVMAMDFDRQRARPELAIAAKNCRAAVQLVQRFRATSETWLRRIGRCRTPGCETPYFLDRSARRGRLRCDRHSRP